jgi:hypothetical protein
MLTLDKPEIITTIRWRKRGLSTINKVDAICREYQCSRATAITMICDRLIAIDNSFNNPLNPSPKFINQ